MDLLVKVRRSYIADFGGACLGAITPCVACDTPNLMKAI